MAGLTQAQFDIDLAECKTDWTACDATIGLWDTSRVEKMSVRGLRPAMHCSLNQALAEHLVAPAS